MDRHKTDVQYKQKPFVVGHDQNPIVEFEAFASIQKLSSQKAPKLQNYEERHQRSINQNGMNQMSSFPSHERVNPRTRNNMSPLSHLQMQTELHEKKRFFKVNENNRNKNTLQSEQMDQGNYSTNLRHGENTRTQLRRMQEKMESLERNTRQQLSRETNIHKGLKPMKKLKESVWTSNNLDLSSSQKHTDLIPSPKIKHHPQHFDLQKSISQSYDSKLAMSAAASKENGLIELLKTKVKPEQIDRGSIFGKNRSTLDHNNTKPIILDHTTAFETPSGPSNYTSSLQTDERVKASLDLRQQNPIFMITDDYLVPQKVIISAEPLSEPEHLKFKVEGLREQLQLLKKYQQQFENKIDTPSSKLVYDKISATANIQNIKKPPKNKRNFFVSDLENQQKTQVASDYINRSNSRLSKKSLRRASNIKQSKTLEKVEQTPFRKYVESQETNSQKAFAYMDKKLQQFDRLKAGVEDSNFNLLQSDHHPSPHQVLLFQDKKMNQSESNRNLRLRQEVQVHDKLKSQRVSSLDLNNLDEQNLTFGPKNPYSIDHLYQNNDYSFQQAMRSHNSSMEPQNVRNSDLIQTEPVYDEFYYQNEILTKEQKRYLSKQQRQMMQISKIQKQKSGQYLSLFDQKLSHLEKKSNESFMKNPSDQKGQNPFSNDYRGNPIPVNLGLVESNSNEQIKPLNYSQLSGYENSFGGVSPNKELAQFRKHMKIKGKKQADVMSSKGQSPYDGIFEMKVKKLQHKKEFQADKMPIIIHNRDQEKNFLLSGHSPNMNDRENLIESKLKQIKEQQSYVRQMKGIDRFKIEKIKKLQESNIYNSKDYQITNERVNIQQFKKITKSKDNSKYQNPKVLHLLNQNQQTNKHQWPGKDEESTHYTTRKTPNKNHQRLKKNAEGCSPGDVSSSRASPSQPLESIDELTEQMKQKEDQDYQTDGKSIQNNKTIKQNKKSSYIQNCLKNNQHYTEEKLKSLNWLRKDPSHETITKNIRGDTETGEQKKLRIKQEIQAKYNQMSKENCQPSGMEDGYNKFVLMKGNNSSLVRRVLDSRDNWSLMTESSLLFSFKWAPISKHINFEQLSIHGQKKMCNHFERHDMITTKDLLFQNMQKFCEQQKLDVFQYLPIQFVIDFSQKNHSQEIDKFCQYFNSIETIRAGSQQSEDQSNLQQINQILTANKNFSHESRGKVGNVFRKYTLGEEMYDDGNVWLIKPNDFNRGRGVKLFNKLSSLVAIIKELTQTTMDKDLYSLVTNTCSIITNNERQFQTSQTKNGGSKQNMIQTSDQKPPNPASEVNLSANVKSEVFIIQKYLERPLLIDNRKFDIRLWVLVTHDLKCYLFREGYIRTSSYQFTLSQESIDQPFIHLTNNAVQQFDQNYGKLEEGNQMSFKQAQQVLEQQGQQVDFYSILDEQIVPVIQMTLKCAEGKINQNQRRFCMEIFGYDFMIDRNLKPWLIEVNTNPCLEETSSLLKEYLPRMLDDAFKLTLDVVFPPQKNGGASKQPTNVYGQNQGAAGQDEPQKNGESGQSWQRVESKFKIDGHSDCENLWRQIYVMK